MIKTLVNSKDDDELMDEESDGADHQNEEGNSESPEDMQDNFEARDPLREGPEDPENTQGNAEDPDNSSEEERNPTILRNELPPRKSHIEYKVKKEDYWQEAIVINRAGKTTGRNKFWMNIKRIPQEEMKSLNFEELNGWRIKNESVLMSRRERHDVLGAKQKELKNLIDHDVYEEVKEQRTKLYLSHMGDNRKNFRWEADC